MCLTSSDHVIRRFLLLQHQPHGFHVFLRVAPVAFGIQVSQVEFLLLPGLDAGDSARDLSRHESLATARAFVIEENATAGEHVVRLAVVYRGPVGINFRDSIRATRMKWCSLSLWRLVHFA